MKNLKFKLVLLLAILSGTTLFSQGFYVSANGGYAFGINGMNGILFNSTTNEIINQQIIESSISTTTDNITLSLGKGVNVGFNAGYMLNKNIGVDLGVSYLFGGKTEGVGKTTTTLTDVNGNVTNYTSETTTTATSKMLRIIPALIITPGFDKLNPYVRLGAVIGFGSYSFETNMVFQPTVSNTTSFVYDWNESVAIGLNAVLGVEYPVSENIYVFGEMSYYGISYAPSKRVLTKYELNGVDQLPNLETSQKETILKDSYTWANNQPINPDEPSVSNKVNTAFSSLGFNFGVKFNLSK